MEKLKNGQIYAVSVLKARLGHSILRRFIAFIIATMITIVFSACSTEQREPTPSLTSQGTSTSIHLDVKKQGVPAPHLNDQQKAALQASKRVSSMSVQDQAAQLVMIPLQAGTAANTVQDDIQNRHIGSVLLFGNSTAGVAAVHAETQTLQSYASNGDGLLIATDQEGGAVQHLKGPGFAQMPSAVTQGQMDTQTLRINARSWGASLQSAGVNVDFAPSVDTVQTQPRSNNAAIGALNRDFGLDANGNSSHASAFIQGMADAEVSTAIKHYPGLGAVAGNTDFTNSGITDSTTTLDGQEISAFDATLTANPAMVMMSLATYSKIDPDNPAAFSSIIMQRHLRDEKHFQGIIVSDSLSAQALSNIAVNELGVRFIQAGGDLVCADAPGYIDTILDGIIDRAQRNTDFAEQVKASATRVLTLKYEKNLVQ
ncbi:MAG: glycoside hydrolase family 3 N-terminal domain-containing protein [Bifidobacterium aquikefiri]|uniref:Beta-glucosidase n=1 Tax=Bifidobacterium aquikefiri TaxID=1653207 RepID=A0A261G604_9BIFI|nr:glycoside hydrolase family 3 N-terminal domain-containing protein [Bifidobacterium aquikefiri]OZG66867.1 beta-glucosidase [Bifidobacterium aquikefiri]